MDEAAHYELPHPHLNCLQIQVFIFGALSPIMVPKDILFKIIL